MTRPVLALGLCLGVLLGCYEGHEAPAPAVAVDTLAVVAGPLQCDDCATLDFEIAGPGLDNAETAHFIARDTARSELAATVVLRRFTTDSGLLLQATVTFDTTTPRGEYDLELVSYTSGSGTSRRIIGRALRVLSVRTLPPSPTGSTPPPAPPPTDPTPPPPPPPPPAITGTVVVTVNVIGTGAPATWSVLVEGGPTYVEDGAVFEVPAAGTRKALPVGQYQMSLAYLPLNCDWAPSPRTVVVVRDSTTDVSFDVTCGLPAYLDVSVTFTGAPPSPLAAVRCSDARCEPGNFAGNATQRLQASPGAHDLVLSVPYNCTVTGPAAVTVTAVPGLVTAVAFQASCTPTTGTLRVTVQGSGQPVPMTVIAGYDGCEQNYDCDGAPIAIGATAELVVPIGQLVFVRLLPGPGCTVADPNPRLLAVSAGERVDVIFDANCQ